MRAQTITVNNTTRKEMHIVEIHDDHFYIGDRKYSLIKSTHGFRSEAFGDREFIDSEEALEAFLTRWPIEEKHFVFQGKKVRTVDGTALASFPLFIDIDGQNTSVTKTHENDEALYSSSRVEGEFRSLNELALALVQKDQAALFEYAGHRVVIEGHLVSIDDISLDVTLDETKGYLFTALPFQSFDDLRSVAIAAIDAGLF